MTVRPPYECSPMVGEAEETGQSNASIFIIIIIIIVRKFVAGLQCLKAGALEYDLV